MLKILCFFLFFNEFFNLTFSQIKENGFQVFKILNYYFFDFNLNSIYYRKYAINLFIFYNY